MSISFEIDYKGTLQFRKKVARDNIVFYSAMEDVDNKELWLTYYNNLLTLSDIEKIMEYPLPNTNA